MTEENKDLLSKDLCSRLPYGVKVEYENKIFDVEYVCPMYAEVKLDNYETWTLDVSEVKPYLFPLDSMTEEQKEEWKSLLIREAFGTSNNTFTPQDFYSKYHLDYRGLIPMGLAIDATGKNIY